MLLLRAVLLFAAALVTRGDGGGGAGEAYSVGEVVRLECRDWHTGAWGPGPHCKETGAELQFSFGNDNFLYCGLEITDDTFKDNVQIVKLESRLPPPTHITCMRERASLRPPASRRSIGRIPGAAS